MHVKWKRERQLYRADRNQRGRARDAVLVRSVRVAGKVRHQSVAHLGTVAERGRDGDSAEGFLHEAAVRVYHHAPADEHARLISKLEAFVSKFVGREAKAPSIDDEGVQERLRSLSLTPEEREARLNAHAERIRQSLGE